MHHLDEHHGERMLREYLRETKGTQHARTIRVNSSNISSLLLRAPVSTAR